MRHAATALTAAVRSSKMTVEDLSHQTHIPVDTLTNMLNGVQKITLSTAYNIAQATGFSYHQIMGDDAASRVRHGSPSTCDEYPDPLWWRLLDWAELNNALEWCNHPSTQAPTYQTSGRSTTKITTPQHAKQLAEQFRISQKLGVAPIINLTNMAVEHTPYDVGVFNTTSHTESCIMVDPQYNTGVVGLAATPNWLGQRAALASELSYVASNTCLGGQHTKQLARVFAQHLLVPEGGVLDLVGETPNTDVVTLNTLVQHFRAPVSMVVQAALDAGVVTENVAETWRDIDAVFLAERFGWLDEYCGLADHSNRFQPTPKLLGRALDAYRDGFVSDSQIGCILSMDECDATTWITERNIVRNPLPDIELHTIPTQQ